MDSSLLIGETIRILPQMAPKNYSKLVLIVVTGSPDDAMAAIVSGNVGCMITDQIMAVKGQELAQIAAGIRKDISIVVFSGAPSPREPIPADAIFVAKDDVPKLIQTVTNCMDRWRVQ